jgi:hypothetical protein
MDERKQVLDVTIGPESVTAVLSVQLEKCANSVLFGLQILEMADENPQSLNLEDGFLDIIYGSKEHDLATRKSKFKAWLLARGFEDLVKAIEYSLREAYYLSSLFDRAREPLKVDDFNKLQSEIRKKALGMHIPAMIEKIEPSLIRILNLKNHILSINKCRNCLVHRSGIVTEKDVNNTERNALVLEWVRLKLFYDEDGQEVEIQTNKVINGGPDGTTVKIKQEGMSLQFGIGESIELDYKLFKEFIITCHQFGIDLQNSLPRSSY